MKADNATKTICRNCGAQAKKSWIEAMTKAGFSLRHIECKKCGQKALAAAGE